MNQDKRHKLMEWHLLHWNANAFDASTVNTMLHCINNDIKEATEVVTQLKAFHGDGDHVLMLWVNELNRLNDLKTRYTTHFQLCD